MRESDFFMFRRPQKNCTCLFIGNTGKDLIQNNKNLNYQKDLRKK